MGNYRIRLEYAEDERWIGGAIYVENLLHTFAALPRSEQPDVELYVVCSAESEILARMAVNPVVRGITRPGRIQLSLQHRLSGFPTFLRALSGIRSCFQCNGHSADITFPVFEPRPYDPTVVYWIPDFQHHFLSHLFDPEELERREKRFRKISEIDSWLILSSQKAKADFLRLYPESKIHTRVWSFCSNINGLLGQSRSDVLRIHNLPNRYLYIPNQFWVHKDHLTAFRALAILKSNGIHADIVCTGFNQDYRSPEHYQHLIDFLERHDLRAQVHILGIVPRSEQIKIYRHAAAVLQPSLFEGWSTVIEDAKAIGRPILASDIQIHKEQLEPYESKYFFLRSSPESLAEVLAQRWHQLTAGPDPSAETAAAADTDRRRAESARAFMQIVGEVVGKRHGSSPKAFEVKRKAKE